MILTRSFFVVNGSVVTITTAAAAIQMAQPNAAWYLLAGLYWLYVASLVAVSIVMAPTAFRALTSKTKGRDFNYLLFWGLGVNRLWFLLHRELFVAPATSLTDAGLLAACYVFATAFELGALRAWFWEYRK